MNFWHPDCNKRCSPLDLVNGTGFDLTISFNFSDLLCIYNTTVFMDRICFPGAGKKIFKTIIYLDVTAVLKTLTGSISK